MRLPLHRFLNAVYAWILERVEKPEEFEYQLNKPIPGMMVTDSTVRDEMDAVRALMGGGW